MHSINQQPSLCPPSALTPPQEDLLQEKQSSQGRAVYCLCYEPSRPGALVLGYILHRTPKREYFMLTPDGVYFRKKVLGLGGAGWLAGTNHGTSQATRHGTSQQQHMQRVGAGRRFESNGCWKLSHVQPELRLWSHHAPSHPSPLPAHRSTRA